MHATIIYAIVIGGLFGLFLTRQVVLLIIHLWRSATVRSWIFQHVQAHLLDRHALTPPLTRLYAATQSAYWVGTAVCNVIGVRSLAEASSRAGTLTTLNIIPLLFGDRLAFAADLLDLSPKTYGKLHRSVGVMTVVQMAVHMVLQKLDGKLDLRHVSDRMALTASICLAAMALLALPFPRNSLYETFLLSHHCLSVLLLYSLWHYFDHARINRIYLIVAIALYATLAVARTIRLAWRTYSHRHGWTKASVRLCDDAIIMTIQLARPMASSVSMAGRYVYISTPKVSLLSFLQRHPFTVAWWDEDSENRTTSISLLIKPQQGYTRSLTQFSLSTDSLTVALDGPYGQHVDTSRYRRVVLFASGIGIASQLPIVKQAVNQYYSRQTWVTRIVLVWQLDRESDENWAKEWMDKIIRVDDKAMILSCFLYISDRQMDTEPQKLGSRVKKTYKALDTATVTSVVENETTQGGGDKVLVAVSALSSLRDKVQDTCRRLGRSTIEYRELAFQPDKEYSSRLGRFGRSPDMGHDEKA